MKFMKRIIIFLICISFLPLLGEITLNKFGHINSIKEEIDIEYSYEDKEYFIKIDKLKLIGTSVFPISHGYLTIVTEHENHPTWLRIYDINGHVRLKKSFPKIINIMFSENKKYAVFSTGRKLLILNLENQEISEYPNSVNFAVDDLGNPIFTNQQNNIQYKKKNYQIQEPIRSILLISNILTIVTKHSIYEIDPELKRINTFKKEIFEAKVIENNKIQREDT